MRFFLDNKLECLSQRDHRLQQDQANYRYVGANSQKLLGRIRQRGFKQVFDILDDDKVSNKSGPWFDILASCTGGQWAHASVSEVLSLY
jgi:hypothetical protein